MCVVANINTFLINRVRTFLQSERCLVVGWGGVVAGFTRGNVLLFESKQSSKDVQTAITVAPPNMACIEKNPTKIMSYCRTYPATF